MSSAGSRSDFLFLAAVDAEGVAVRLVLRLLTPTLAVRRSATLSVKLLAEWWQLAW
jgi:hypothetical protein